jgi:hypothetical protein
MGRPITDRTGQKFNRLTVTSFHEVINRHARWLCTCNCGNQVIVYGSNLQSGVTQSCGCLHTERASESNVKNKTTHGLRYHPLYRTWSSMMTRCYNKRYKDYKDYGGRGIIVIERWHDVATFINDILASIGPCPEGKSFDRVNNNGNYEWGNVTWSTAFEQVLNRRNKSFEAAERIKQLLDS